MARRDGILLKVSWISLAANGLAILVFGLAAAAMPAPRGTPYVRAIGVASIGMGLFGLMISLVPYRRRERWAWATLWSYPIFWTAHLAANLPPGEDHLHQIALLALSAGALLLGIPAFFPRAPTRAGWR